MIASIKNKYINNEIISEMTWVDKMSIGFTGLTALGYVFVDRISCGANIFPISLTNNNVVKFLSSLGSVIKFRFTTDNLFVCERPPILSFPRTLFYFDIYSEMFMIFLMIFDLYVNIYRFYSENRHQSYDLPTLKILSRVFMFMSFGFMGLIDNVNV